MKVTDPASRLIDLYRQGFMKPRRVKKVRVKRPIVACMKCQDWHEEGRHHTKKQLEERRLAAIARGEKL